MVYPEYQGHGYARLAIGHFQREHTLIVADRVRYDARPFWAKMGFCAENIDHYVWHGEGDGNNLVTDTLTLYTGMDPGMETRGSRA